MNRITRVLQGRSNSFQHRFGGAPAHRGVKPHRSGQPVHLVYNFDCEDPLVPLRVRGARYLPLYYCFPYNAGAVGYRVVSDTEIEILYMETKEVLPNFPYENYPHEFPETPVKLVPVAYEEHKTLVYYLACEDYNLTREYLNKEDRAFLKQSGYPFTQLGGIQRMWQGTPDVPCPNKKCKYHKFNCFMQVFAVVWNQPVPNVYLWDDDPESRDDAEVQTIFQVCPLCNSIYACNRCT